jgi:DNA invertase Pin-like site-specific DNA recombinase
MFHELLQTTGPLKRPHETVRGASDDFKRVESHDCPMSTCAAPAGSPCRTGKGKVAIQYHTTRFRLVPQLAKVLNVPTPAVRKPGSMWTELPRPVSAGAEPAGQVRLGYARTSTARQSLDAQLDSLAEAGVTRIFSEKISTRATRRPELEAAVKLAGEIRSSGVAVTLVVHEHKRLGRGIELAMLTEELKASDVGLEFLTGEVKGSHDPSGIVFTVLAAMSGMEREYIRDRTLEGHESARKRQDDRWRGRHRRVDAVHRPPPARAGDEPARHRQTPRHHHWHEEGPAPLTRHRHAHAA